MKPRSIPTPDLFRKGALGVLLLLLSSSLAAAGHPQQGAVRGVVCVGMTVSNLDESIAFFRDVLDFELIDEQEAGGDSVEALYGVFGSLVRTARMRLGEEEVELTQFLAPEGRPIPVDSRSNDRWFQHIAIITPDMDAAYTRLREHKIRHASAGPQRLPDWNPNAGGIKAFYFKDGDGHVLEILEFPEGKGNPKWREKAAARPGALFLGIDHTAIVVSDTETSLAFYRDTLGLRVLGASENHGIEQERLNNVFGARLRITSLSAGSGPAIEFLDYLAPDEGRPYPADSYANDLWHWRTTVAVSAPQPLFDELKDRPGTLVSSGIIETAAGEGAEAHAWIIRDPDGHALQLVHQK